MTYKKQIQAHLQSLIDEGMSQREIAEALGLGAPNFISMILSDRCPETVLPLTRLPALCTLCRLSPPQCLGLVKGLIGRSDRASVHLDESTFDWLIGNAR